MTRLRVRVRVRVSLRRGAGRRIGAGPQGRDTRSGLTTAPEPDPCVAQWFAPSAWRSQNLRRWARSRRRGRQAGGIKAVGRLNTLRCAMSSGGDHMYAFIRSLGSAGSAGSVDAADAAEAAAAGAAGAVGGDSVFFCLLAIVGSTRRQDRETKTRAPRRRLRRRSAPPNARCPPPLPQYVRY